MKIISKDEKTRMAYEAREAEIHDQTTKIKIAREKGRAELIKSLIKIGMDVEQISRGSGLLTEKVKEKNSILN